MSLLRQTLRQLRGQRAGQLAAADAAPPSLEALRARADQLGAALPGLMLDVERVANSVYLGAHGRRRPGSGERFWQYRDYSTGEPASRIDWRQSARRDGLFVREMEWEAGQTVLFWVDASGAMQFTSQPGRLPTKQQRALVLALALARLLIRGGEFVGAAQASTSGGRRPSASGGQRALETLAQTLLLTAQDQPPNAPPPRQAHGLWFTDGLSDLPALQRALGQQRERRTQGLLVQVLDPSEIDFPFRGRVRFLSAPQPAVPIGRIAAGTGGVAEATIDRSEGIREAYLSKMAGHRAALSQAARHAGWRHLALSTGDSAEANLADLVAYLQPLGTSGRPA